MPSQREREPPLPPLPPIPSASRFGVTAHPSNLPRSQHPTPAPGGSRQRLLDRQNAQTMAAMSMQIPTIPPRGHSRSISQPFPFPGAGKRRNKHKAEMWESDSDSEDTTLPSEIVDRGPRKDIKAGSDLAETRCPTCNSIVRWPRNLKEFRCSACLMVTDLSPDTPAESKPPATAKGDMHPVDGKPKRDPFKDRPLPPLPPNAQPPENKSESPFSLRQMGTMIDQCVSAYFDHVLQSAPAALELARHREVDNGGPKLGNDLGETANGFTGFLADPRECHTRSVSGSGLRSGRQGSDPSFLSPDSFGSHVKGEMPVRTRANSDLQSSSKLDSHRHDEFSEPGRRDSDYSCRIFEQLEQAFIAALKETSLLNTSFLSHRSFVRSASSGNHPKMKLDLTSMMNDPTSNTAAFEPDAKTLLLGDLAENSSWWMTEWAQAEGHMPIPAKERAPEDTRLVSSRSPRINWAEVGRWYQLLLTAGDRWAEQWAAKRSQESSSESFAAQSKRSELVDLACLEKAILDSRTHLQRTFMKAVEKLLKRPRRLLKKADDTRWLFILLANPLLSSASASPNSRNLQSTNRGIRRPSHPTEGPSPNAGNTKITHKESSREGVNQHYGITKRILGLMSNTPEECHHHFISWFSRLTPSHFTRLVELIGGFITYRLTRQQGRKRSEAAPDGDDLVPTLPRATGSTPAELHAAINNRRSPTKKSAKQQETPVVYGEDWQIIAGSKMLSLLFTANTEGGRKAHEAGRDMASHRHHLAPISAFYNTLLDYSDLIADFEIWESKSSKFSFCQYPFLLSIWAKIHIMEHDARRQMEVQAREAFFKSILNHRAVSQYLVLKVRRDCLIEDSLRAVSESVATGSEEIKKGLRIEFVGEEGVDAGGLRKEWFLLLVREVFNPDHGLFTYDDDSKYCYFNPHCFESSEQFYLVGILLGLAIYNSTILDIDLPPFAFRKLLAAAPQYKLAHPSPHRSKFKCTLYDLAEYRPTLARGLRNLLEFEGDVAETFCYDFVIPIERYGEISMMPLCPGGEKRPVTNSNRREFVELYVFYLLNTAVARQFEPFKRGFFTVCGGNALSLFRSEEIELLIRGSDEPLDVTSLRAVASYDNWSTPRPEAVAVVQWFWQFFEGASPQAQRKILSFVTGSDRIPAMGATSLSIRLACLGDDCPRYPIARTCFNTLGLYRYGSRQKFEKLLWDAVVMSEGFGLK
ncbi:Uncharacterized protein PECH_005825 [Penicillium ucsense]|uniref:HECT-type E3 ubiquitin transferase n=1 Tax=Penicillium ucsense TaxID=2839758 RepID=A0A8J8VXX2_9EURO|nr:Uncharacterized protein PECM_000559 [Penicillium ucsense]KAF7736127.1 Uncharacterized protein PECH_005825 [Penicillium ucsense]